MKTTIDIPAPLYRQVKIRAAESGKTLKAIVLESLIHELAQPRVAAGVRSNYWSNRKLVPEYETALEEGAFSGGADSTQIVSEERNDR